VSLGRNAAADTQIRSICACGAASLLLSHPTEELCGTAKRVKFRAALRSRSITFRSDAIVPTSPADSEHDRFRVVVQFRRVNGHLHLPKLRAALETHFQNVSATTQNEGQKAA
jgi:hypothetical protein